MEYHIKTLEQLKPILISFRKQAGLSQTAVASLLGVSQQSYAKIEANPSATSFERLFKILAMLGADIIFSDRVPAAGEISPPRATSGEDSVAGPYSRDEATSAAPLSGNEPKKNQRKPIAPPPKLTPPSKKPERW